MSDCECNCCVLAAENLKLMAEVRRIKKNHLELEHRSREFFYDFTDGFLDRAVESGQALQELLEGKDG